MSDHPVVRLERRDDAIALIIINRPPVNAIDVRVRSGLIDAIAQVEADSKLKAVVIACEGRTFLSGADLSEFGSIAEPGYTRVMATLEGCSKPVVAALHGSVLGGGLEVALACHYRVAVPGTRVGLPEITLGVLPGAGGTQRLPRLVGLKTALEMMISGALVEARAALSMGLLDSVSDGDPATVGVEYARKLLAEGAGPRRTGDRAADTTGFDDAAVAKILQDNAKSLKGRTTQTAFVEAVRAASLPLEQGLKVEAGLADKAVATAESRALRHAFFAERAVAKIPGLSGAQKPLPIRSVAVVGAGTMGSGIAMSFSNAGLSVILIDAKPQGLERGVGLIRSTYEGNAKRGRMTPEEAQQSIDRIKPTLELSALADVDLVVEAVFENTPLKKQVLAEIDRLAAPRTIIATNTSSLSIDDLAAATRRPDKVIGLHFFSPAHVMRLLEIVRGASTSAETLLTGVEVARRIKKTGVISGDGFGFIGNRMMLDGYFREAEQLLLEGARVEQVDAVMERFGFAMGPSRVNDMGGIDIGTQVRQQLYLRESRPDPYCIVSDTLTPLGRLGQKTGKGFYSYAEDPRSGKPDPEVTAIIARLAAERGIQQREISDAEIEERCVLQLVNVGADILSEGIAYRSGDIDVVWLFGYGFPRRLGGPMAYADELGLAHVLARIRYYHERHGHYWKPSALLVDLASRQSSFARHSEIAGST
jgi:3-hydroxyacyl-CoA dehydrogenase